MDVNKLNLPAWLDESHPNYIRWKRSRDLAVERGRFVTEIISKAIKPQGLFVLDVGSGEGGTSFVLSKNNFVISFDNSLTRLERQQTYKELFCRIKGSASFIPFKNNSFDLIILQDVIEHLNNGEEAITNLHALLKKGGLLYLSTPNRSSVLNMLSDPHWGFPLVSLFKRKTTKKYFLKYFRQAEYNRNDIAELYSLTQLEKLFDKKFEYKLFTEFSLQMLLEGNKGIVWSNFHLIIIKLVNFFRLDIFLKKIATDKPAILNKYFNPTFYFILKKL